MGQRMELFYSNHGLFLCKIDLGSLILKQMICSLNESLSCSENFIDAVNCNKEQKLFSCYFLKKQVFKINCKNNKPWDCPTAFILY